MKKVIAKCGTYSNEIRCKSNENKSEYFQKSFFNLNYREDPGEIIIKEKILNSIYYDVTPNIKNIEVDENRIKYLYEYKSEEFKKDEFNLQDSYKYGEFVGKIHGYKVQYFGNLYNYKCENAMFGKRFCICFKNLIEATEIKYKDEVVKKFYEYKDKIENLNITSSTFVMLDIKPSNYIFDKQGNIIGLLNINKLVLAPPELELLYWKLVLKENFGNFLEGYTKYIDYNLQDSDIFGYLLDIFHYDEENFIKYYKYI